MDPANCILFGHDQGLLRSRGWLLETCGYSVSFASSMAECNQLLSDTPCFLLVLCHSLFPEERQFAVTLSRLLRPEAEILDLATELDSTGARPLAQVLQSSAGPRELRSWVQELSAAHLLPKGTEIRP